MSLLTVDPARVLYRYIVAAAVTRKIGLCQLCQQSVRCPNGKLSHHGYKRPGIGYIHGSCPATGMKPWEVSPETGELGIELTEEYLITVKGLLVALPNVTSLDNPYRQKPYLKAELPEARWAELLQSREKELNRNLEQAEKNLENFKQLVRDWAPSEMTTVEEEQRKKDERKQVVNDARRNRYEENKKKTVDWVRKAYKRLITAETALKVAKDPEKIGKFLIETSKAAATIFESYAGKSQKLQQNYPEDVPIAFILADLGLDDVWQHMGLLHGGTYASVKEAREGEGKCKARYGDQGQFLYLGLDYWAPFWPGWTGTVHLPPGTTGRSDTRRFWPKP